MAEVELKRFLYLGTEEPRFVTGNSELHGCFVKDKLSSICNMFYDEKNNHAAKDVLNNIMQSVNSQNLLPKRETIFFALAVAARLPNIAGGVRHDIYTLVLNLAKNNDDLFSFIKFYSKEKRLFPSGVNKLIGSYYLNMDPMDLAKSLTASNSYHGWTHKDLIKLSHCKTDDVVKEVILTYVLYGQEKAKEKANGNDDAIDVLQYFSKAKQFLCCNDERKVAELLTELGVRRLSQIPTKFNRSHLVWEALVPNMPLGELIRCLPKLYKLGFLKPTSTVHGRVIEALTEGDASRVHPVEVFIGIRNLEKGGKPKDPHLIKYLENKEATEGKTTDPDYKKPDFAHQEPAKCPSVISALNKTLTASYDNLQPTAKRIMVTVDVGAKMKDPCLTTKNVTCVDAAALLALCLFKADKQVTVAVFNGSTVTPVELDKDSTLSQATKTLKEAKNGSVMWSSAFEWAMDAKKTFDVFVNLCQRPPTGDNSEAMNKARAKVAFANYRKRLNSQARLITCCLGIHNLDLADGSAYMLDVCGFDRNVPKVIEAFCKELF